MYVVIHVIHYYIPLSAVKTHPHTDYTQPFQTARCIKMFTDCCHVCQEDTKTTKQAVMIGFDLIQCYTPPL